MATELDLAQVLVLEELVQIIYRAHPVQLILLASVDQPLVRLVSRAQHLIKSPVK